MTRLLAPPPRQAGIWLPLCPMVGLGRSAGDRAATGRAALTACGRLWSLGGSRDHALPPHLLRLENFTAGNFTQEEAHFLQASAYVYWTGGQSLNHYFGCRLLCSGRSDSSIERRHAWVVADVIRLCTPSPTGRLPRLAA